MFDQVFISFLPTGHTHFDPDQFASRIAVALKFRNVKTVEEYIDVIQQCWGSPVTVEWIHEVMDIKELFNPGKDPNFAVGTAIVRQLRGIGTKTIQPYRKEFMDETSPLHWRVKKDLNGKAIVQSKFTIDDLSWSAGHQMFDTFAPRPGGRVFAEHTSGVFPSDVGADPALTHGLRNYGRLSTKQRSGCRRQNGRKSSKFSLESPPTRPRHGQLGMGGLYRTITLKTPLMQTSRRRRIWQARPCSTRDTLPCS